MATTIDQSVINGIDGAYPVAGQDNDSQGFRDNFSAIKTTLTSAATDIANLDTNTAKLNVANNFLGNDVSGANFIANTTKVYGVGTVSASQNISWLNGDYQTLTAGNSALTLTLTDWPADGKMGFLRLVVLSNQSSTITWSVGAGTLRKHSDFPSSFVINSAVSPIIVDFWSSDGGDVVYAQSHGAFSS